MSAEDAPERRRGDRRREDENRFWRALKGERRVSERRRGVAAAAADAARATKPRSDDAPDPILPGPDGAPEDTAAETRGGPSDAGSDGTGVPADTAPPSEEARRHALRHMLRAAEARQSRAGRTRRPVLAEGRRVAIARGELAGRAGVIVDADYIDSRVLLHVDGQEAPAWVPFSRVAAIDEPSAGEGSSAADGSPDAPPGGRRRP